jgi:hypothetical protein
MRDGSDSAARPAGVFRPGAAKSRKGPMRIPARGWRRQAGAGARVRRLIPGPSATRPRLVRRSPRAEDVQSTRRPSSPSPSSTGRSARRSPTAPIRLRRTKPGAARDRADCRPGGRADLTPPGWSPAARLDPLRPASARYSRARPRRPRSRTAASQFVADRPLAVLSMSPFRNASASSASRGSCSALDRYPEQRGERGE